MFEKDGSIVTKIRGLGKYLVHSAALAGSLLYSNAAYSQDQPPEQQPEPAAQETAEEIKKRLIEEIKERERIAAEKRANEQNPEQPTEQAPEEQPVEQPKEVEKPKELKTLFYREPESHFIWHSRGGPTPNGDLQGARAYSSLDISFKEFIRSGILFTNRSSSYLDKDNKRIIENSPLNGHADLKLDLENVKLEFGFTGSLEEKIMRETSEINQTIGSSSIQVITRNKVRDIEEYYAGIIRADIGGLRISINPYEKRLPTIRTHEIFQKVTDSSNPSASFTSLDELRSPTPRNKTEGVMFSLGSNKRFNKIEDKQGKTSESSLTADLVGIFERELIELYGTEKREIQRIYGGADIRADLGAFVPRVLALQGFYDDRIGEQRYGHKASSTKLLGSIYLDLGQLKFAEQKLKSDDPKIESIKKSKHIPVLLGGSVSLDSNYEDNTNKYARPSIRGVLGIGSAFSGREALENILQLEYTTSMADLGLTKEYGHKFSESVLDSLSSQLPVNLANPEDWGRLGLLGILQVSREDQGSSKKPGYSGSIYGVLGPLTANASYSNNGFETERTGASLGFYPKKAVYIGLGYLESKEPGKTKEPWYTASFRVQLKWENYYFY